MQRSKPPGASPEGAGLARRVGAHRPASRRRGGLAADGNGTLTFSSPFLSKSVTLSPQISVYFTHRQDSGQNAAHSTPENNWYASSGHVCIGFSFYENAVAEAFPNAYVSVTSDNQYAACYARIR